MGISRDRDGQWAYHMTEVRRWAYHMTEGYGHYRTEKMHITSHNVNKITWVTCDKGGNAENNVMMDST